MDRSNIIECGGFCFIHNFDSGNLGHVERIPTEQIAPTLNHKTNVAETPNYEFNLWTRPDCAGTEFENGNRTWFYFGIQASEPNILVRLNLINLNKQGKMYTQGMAPVTRTLPGKPQWERIKDRPIHSTDDNTFTLSFKFKTADNVKATTFFAFTYPFSFAELQIALNSIDLRMLPIPPVQSPDELYYHRECLIYSLEGRRVDLLTISSHHGITTEREDRLKNLFPDNQPRPFKFQNKKVIFMSARVHPGETPSSFVFNGFLNLLLTKADPIAILLRKLYVFKMIPFLNPDGVARGHYRTDTRGVNLNRVYLNPSLAHHPTVYASRALIRYYHFGCEKEDTFDDCESIMSRSIQDITESVEVIDNRKKKPASIAVKSSEMNKKEDKKPNKSLSTKSSSPTKSINTKKSSYTTSEASTLVNQVCDLKLQETPSETMDLLKPSDQSSLTLPTDNSVVLNDEVVNTCLGSNIHLSTSEEMNIPGQNPLRPLRDALKNSISLLMESSSSVVGDSRMEGDESRLSLKMGWCRECRRAVNKLENSMPGITYMVPGYSASINDTDTTNDDKREMVYFCTNCFKRYTITEANEEMSLSPSPIDGEACNVSGADSGDARLPPTQSPHSPPPEITTSPKKEEKPKSPIKQVKKKVVPSPAVPAHVAPAARASPKEPDSGLYLYIDLHGHASKKGIFMYGNHFEDLDSSVECMLLPRIMSLNNLHFHFSSCNFTERNMYLKDRRDGMSREGSGRVAVLKATGLVRSYTLECNYNTGRLVNVLPPAPSAPPAHAPHAFHAPPKYTPHIYEEVRLYRPKISLEVFKDIDPFQVGRSLGASILDLTGQHPASRVPSSEHRSLAALRDWLRAHSRSLRPPRASRPPQLTMSRLRPKTSSPTRPIPLYARSKAKVTDLERKENAYGPTKSDAEKRRSPPVLAQRSGHEIINLNVKYVKKNEPVKSTSRTKYLAENEPKPKTLSTKRRNILAIRKPNTSKNRPDGVVKSKSKRSVDGSETPRNSVTPKLSKRSYSRNLRGSRLSNKAMASSSSEDMLGGSWEEVGTILGSQSGIPHPESLSMAGKRRPFPTPSPARLKKIRLKTVI